MRRHVKGLIIAAAILFNGILLLGSLRTYATDPPPKQKGVIGSYQGLLLCHCPDDLQTCWCN